MNTGFQYFPERLYSNPVRMTNVKPLTFFGMSNPQEVFYSIKDGNWNDTNIWETVSGRTGKLPSATDDVYVRHTVTLNATSSINNFYISGTFKADNSSRVINVNGDLQATGNVDFTSSNINVNLYGVNNYIVSFTSGTTSTITYARSGDQPIMNLSYKHISLINSGNKNFTFAPTINGNLLITGSVVCDLTTYDLTVNGTTTIGANNDGRAHLLKTGSGNVLFIGRLTVGDAGGGDAMLDFRGGDPSVECRGGVAPQSNGVATVIYGGTSNTWTFTTNSQNTGSVSSGNGVMKLFNMNIANGISVTNSGKLWIDGTLNGSNSTSSFTNSGTSAFLLLNTNVVPMATGILDLSAVNCVTYAYNGDLSLPPINFYSLEVLGTGTKSLSANTTFLGRVSVGFSSLGNSLTIPNNTSSILDLAANIVSIAGQTKVLGTLYKTGAGDVTFIGSFAIGSATGAILDFTGGNPNVECRAGGGWSSNSGAGFTSIYSGAGTWKFTTNNQSLSNTVTSGGGPCMASFNNIVISGAITLTLSGEFMTVTGTINGDNAGSIFDSRYTLHYQNATAPMVTGKLYCNQGTVSAVNIWYYDLSGNQDIQVLSDPSSPGYSKLKLAGSGAKRLLGNVSVKSTYTLTSPATLDSNGFALTNP